MRGSFTELAKAFFFKFLDEVFVCFIPGIMVLNGNLQSQDPEHLRHIEFVSVILIVRTFSLHQRTIAKSAPNFGRRNQSPACWIYCDLQ